MKQLKEALQEIIFEALLEESKVIRFHGIRKPELTYKEKQVNVDSNKHLNMLKRTLDHLVALRSVYPTGSANRHIISQACTRIKRLINKLEKNSLI